MFSVPGGQKKLLIFYWDSFYVRLNSLYKTYSYNKKKHKRIKAYMKRSLLILDLIDWHYIKCDHFDYSKMPKFSLSTMVTKIQNF